MKKIVLLVCGVLLAGCNFTKKYTPPALPVSATWPEDLIKTEQKPLMQWKSFFKSAALQELIQQALANNKDLRVALLNIELARSAYQIQKIDALPTVYGQMGVNRQYVPSAVSRTGASALASQFSAALAFTSYEVDLFGKVRNMRKAALESYLATVEARSSAQISLVAEVANAYLQLLSNYEMLSLANQTCVLQERVYNLAKASYKEGISSQFELMSVQSAIEIAKANQLNYQMLVEQNKNVLTMLVGVSDLKKMTFDKTLNAVTLAGDIAVDIPSKVLLNRPDIKRAEHLLKSQNANIGAARAAFFPSISLTGSYGYSSSSLNNLFKGGDLTKAWTFVPQATIPIFNIGNNIVNLKVVKTQHQIAIVNYEKAVQAAFREVADALTARQSLEKQLKLQNELVQIAQNEYNLSNSMFKHGVVNYSEVLSAQQALLMVQQKQVLMKVQHATSLVNLYKSLGGGNL